MKSLNTGHPRFLKFYLLFRYVRYLEGSDCRKLVVVCLENVRYWEFSVRGELTVWSNDIIMHRVPNLKFFSHSITNYKNNKFICIYIF